MAKQTFSPKGARAKSRAQPRPSKGTFKAGYGGSTVYGSGPGKLKVEKRLFKPGKRTGATGPESGRHGN